MQIIVSGKHIDVGDALKQHVEARVEASVSKYLDKVNRINVVFSKQGHAFRVDISGNIGTHSGLALQSRAEGSDPYGAFDTAADKMEKQLRRYKRQLKNHHAQKNDESAVGTQYVIEDSTAEDVPENPLIIAETPANIEHLTVSDAVMRLDLGHLSALVFINSANERVNMIYRRPDGNIAWVDPNLDNAKVAAA